MWHLFLNSFSEVSLARHKLRVFKVHNLLVLMYIHTCELITAIKIMNTSMSPKSFRAALCHPPSCPHPPSKE